MLLRLRCYNVREHRFRVALREYIATFAYVVNVRKHRFCVALIKYVATFAHVVIMREHRFQVALIEYEATIAHVVNVREHRFQVICSDGAKALKAVTGKNSCSKQFKCTEVSHKKQQFVIKNESSSTTVLRSQAPSTLTSHGKF